MDADAAGTLLPSDIGGAEWLPRITRLVYVVLLSAYCKLLSLGE